MIGLPALIGILLISFALGSVPNGVVIGKVFYHTDIRKQGSGNIGTTNAIRAIGKVGGYAVFVLDFGKGLLSGLIALWIATALGGNTVPGASFTVNECLSVAFLGCVLGHIFTPWLKFHGGKGDRRGRGLRVRRVRADWRAYPACAVHRAGGKHQVRFLGSVAAAAAEPFVALYVFWGDWLAIVICLVTGIIVVWAHRENIKRLASGTERRVGDKKSAAAQSGDEDKGAGGCS